MVKTYCREKALCDCEVGYIRPLSLQLALAPEAAGRQLGRMCGGGARTHWHLRR